MANSSEDLLNHSDPEYEYYDYKYDVSFEGLQVNKYSIVIAFWVGLAVFMIFLFIILMIMSRSGFAQVQSNNSRTTSAGKQSNQVQEEETNINHCGVSTLLPASVGEAGCVNTLNEQACHKVPPVLSDRPRSLLDSTRIPGGGNP